MGPASLSQQAGRSGPGSILDGPPPHPQMQSPMPPGGGGMGNGGMGGGMAGVPAGRALPQEVVLGLLQTGSTIGDMIDTMAQMAPDIAVDLAGCKDLLQRALAKLMTAGGGLTPPGPMSGPLPGATPVSFTG